MKKYVTLFLVFAGLKLSANTVLTWDEAVFRVLNQSPELRISSNDIVEKSGVLIQSEFFPNPVFSYSVENVFGYREWGGWKAAESRYVIEQPVELGGKRGYRSRAASYQVCAVQAEYEAGKVRVLNHLSKLFADAVAAQALFALSKEQERVSEEVFKTVRSKVDEGRSTIIDVKKAEIEYFTANIDAKKALVDFSIAKEKLSIMWGDTSPDFEYIDWPFYELENIKSLEECQTDLEDHPEWVRSHFEYLSAQQNVFLEKSERIPNLVVTVGYKTEQDSHDKGFVLGASFPLNVFNWNQGNIQKARSESQKAYDKGFVIRLKLENKLLSNYKEWVRATQEVEQIKTTILTAAHEAFELSQEGYDQGKYGYLEVLHAQDTLFEVKKRYIQALLNYHRSKADIKYLNSEDISL
jgi:cobalt-zinc-cadmium efflux system outer membrane protein